VKKQHTRKRTFLYIFAALLLITIGSAAMVKSFTGFVSINEMLLFQIFTVLLYVAGYHRVWFSRISLMKRLLLMGGVLVIFWILVDRVSSFIMLQADEVHNIANEYVFILILVGFLGWIVLQFCKNLIFVQQSKSTLTMFRVLLVVVFIRILAVVIYTHMHLAETMNIHSGVLDSVSNSGFMLDDNMDFVSAGNIFTILIVSVAVINAFRVKWIHYLGKGDKVISLFLVAFFAVIAGDISGSTSDLTNMSQMAGAFVHSIALIALVYTSVAVVAIFFLLPSAGIMDKKMRELKSFQDLSSTIGSIFETDLLCKKAVRLAAEISGSDTAWIELYANNSYTIPAAYGKHIANVEKHAVELQAIRNDFSADTKGIILINDWTKDKRARPFGRKIHKKGGSLIASALFHKDKKIGYIYGITLHKYGFTDEIKGLFEAFAYQIAVALENANLVQLTIEQQIFREELRVAHDAQMRLLPRSKPLTSIADIDGFCMTANEIGGDLYDFISVSDDRIDLFVGDVSGKGASAAFYMAELKGVLLALAHYVDSPVEILSQANSFVRKNFEPGMFATMAYTVFIPSKKVIRFARAGHPPLIIIRDGSVRMIESAGMGLGLAQEKEFKDTLEEKELSLEKDDMMIIYTDGITEARNLHDEEYGEDAFVELLQGCADMRTEEVLKKIRSAIGEFSSGTQRHDDVTAVVLRIMS